MTKRVLWWAKTNYSLMKRVGPVVLLVILMGTVLLVYSQTSLHDQGKVATNSIYVDSIYVEQGDNAQRNQIQERQTRNLDVTLPDTFEHRPSARSVTEGNEASIDSHAATVSAASGSSENRHRSPDVFLVPESDTNSRQLNDADQLVPMSELYTRLSEPQGFSGVPVSERTRQGGYRPSHRFSQPDRNEAKDTTDVSPKIPDLDLSGERLKSHIATLLARADSRIARERLTLPKGQSALDSYNEILSLVPNHGQAIEGINKIKKTYEEWAEAAKQQGDSKKEALYHERASGMSLRESVISGFTRTKPTMHASARASLRELGWDVAPAVLVDRATAGDAVAVRLLLKAGLPPDADTGAYDFTPLMFATLNGHTAVIDALLDHEADIDAQSRDGRTALMAAAWNGHERIVEMLLDRNADVNVQNRDGWTALAHGVWRGHFRIVQMLLDHGANPHTRNRDGWSPFETARHRGHKDVANLLATYSSSERLHYGENQMPDVLYDNR